jgi:hypothetical protein
LEIVADFLEKLADLRQPAQETIQDAERGEIPVAE